jgi:hypothetical protein
VLLVGCVIGGLGAVLTDSDQPAASDAGPGAPPPPPAAPSEPADPAPPGPEGLGPGEERTGSGPAIVALDLPPGGLHTVTLSHSGEGVFSTRLLDTAGEFSRGLAIGSGDFTGTYPVELRAFGEPGAVDITDADGTWTILIEPLADAPLWPEQTSGSGADVLRVDPDADASQVAVTHNGVANVFMWGHVEGDYEDLMVNEIGEWSGEADLRPDTFVLEIDADGEWTVEPA